MARHNYLIGHNTSPEPEQPNPSRLTALTPAEPTRKALVTRESSLNLSRDDDNCFLGSYTFSNRPPNEVLR